MPLYLITSPTGKQYVGITTLTVNRRMTGHRTAARLGSPYPLHAAIRKYGFEAMTIETLNPSRDLNELHQLEIGKIAELNTQAPNGYNLTTGGEGTTGHEVTEEQKANLSACMSERWLDPDFVAMRKVKASETIKRLNADPEHKAKLKAGAQAYWTPERLAEKGRALSEKQKALWADPEYYAKHAPRLIERNQSQGMRAASSAAAKLTRAKQTPERRREITQLAVAARAANRAKIDALPDEEREQIKAKMRIEKSAGTKAGLAAAKAARTPEQEEAVRERYRQAALRRTPEQKEKMAKARRDAFGKKKAAGLQC